MSWIFTVIIWSLLPIILFTNEFKTKIALTMVQIIVLLIQIIYIFLKS